jgi:hypothetical protein
VVIRHTQGCTATSLPFKLNPGQQVTVAAQLLAQYIKQSRLEKLQQLPLFIT